MRGALYFAAAAAVALTAFWAYRVNYVAQEALGRVADLRAEIAAEREALAVLRAEWAWLNAPERLARLAATHGEPLMLEPVSAERFAAIEEIAEPPPESFWARVDLAVLAEAIGGRLPPERPR